MFMALLFNSKSIFAQKKVPLHIDFPEASFISRMEYIPKGAKLDPNPIPPYKRLPLLVPEGLKNIALKKSVTCRKSINSSQSYSGELNIITDGNKESEEWYYSILYPNIQWVQIDLEKSFNIYAIAIWHKFDSKLRIYKDVIVQISDDSKFKKNVTTVFNNDSDNSSKLGKGTNYEYLEELYGLTIDAKGIKGHYVRCYSNGSYSDKLNYYTEIEIYGK